MMASLEKKTRKPAELSSIINVVQQHSKSGQKSAHPKSELKSVVHITTEGRKKTVPRSQHDHKSPKASKSMMDKPKLLLPFGHQVSGRASMLCYDETTILKPYVSRELYFYQSLPQELKGFTPQFRGLVTVSFIEDSKTAAISAYALPRTLVKPNAQSIIKLFAEVPKAHSKRCVKDYGNSHVIYPDPSVENDVLLNMTSCLDKDIDMFVEPLDHDSVSHVIRDEDVVSELSQDFDTSVSIDDTMEAGKENQMEQTFSTTGLHNPWNTKVLDDAWLKLKSSDVDDPASGKKKRFTLLENVVAGYRRPCVLDLKIGTRIRENASPEKVARHVTAIYFGARLSGMQIYHPDKEKFSYHNKYYGHNLTVAGFKANLRHFFSRGTFNMSSTNKKQRSDLRSTWVDKDLIEQAIQKLVRLRNIIESMKSHRFYSSSLLLLYEGDTSLPANAGDKLDRPIYDHMDDETPENDSSEVTPRTSSFSDINKRLKHNENENGKYNKSSAKDRRGTSHESHQYHDEGPQRHKSTVTVSSVVDNDWVLPQSSKVKSDSHDSAQSPPHRSTQRKKGHDYSESRSHESRSNTSKDHSSNDQHGSTSAPCPASKSRHVSSSPKHRKSQKVKSHADLSRVEFDTHHDNQKRDHVTKKNARRNAASTHKSWPERAKFTKLNSQHIYGHHRTSSLKDKAKYEDGDEMECESNMSLLKDSDAQSLQSHHRNVIDVRMIDFAHYCYHDNVMHPDLDRGFVFGLDNLIKLLKEMLRL